MMIHDDFKSTNSFFVQLSMLSVEAFHVVQVVEIQDEVKFSDSLK